MRKIIIAIALFVAPCISLNSINAQTVKNICGSYTYYVPATESTLVAKQNAAHHARVEALAAEYGRVVSMENTTLVKEVNGESNSFFYSGGGSLVKGEWLADVMQPEYEYGIDPDTGTPVITVNVCGKARKIQTINTPLDARILRNGLNDKHESNFFVDGDDFYASFLAPIDGYLTIYWMSEDIEAFPILPYKKDKRKTYPITANQRYVFFHEPDKNNIFSNITEYTVQCQEAEELNTLYFVFSQKDYEKPLLKEEYMDFKTFNQWLGKLQQLDTTAQVVRKIFLIKNK